MRLPQQLHFRFGDKSKCSKADQQHQVFDTNRNAAQEIFKRAEIPAVYPFTDQPRLEIVFQVGDQIKSQINTVIINRCLHKASIHTGEFDTGAAPPRLIHIYPCAIEPPKVINHRHHKL